MFVIRSNGSATEKTATPTAKPKRTRICGPQSKNGCVTCKTRRIKCDEEKPSCLRCARSGRVCGGYPSRMISDTYIKSYKARRNEREAYLTSQQMNPSPSWALTTGYVRSERQHHLLQCGLTLLSSDTLSYVGGAVLDTLLAQLCLTIPSVTVAAIALGAIHQWQGLPFISDLSAESGFFAASQYRMALRQMQQHLLTQPDGPIPLVIICFILSLVEVMWQQEANALFHLRAASKLLKDRRDGQRSSSSPAKVKQKSFETKLKSLEDSIEFILRAVDFHICSYALSRLPDLAPISIPLVLPHAIVEDLNTAHIVITQLVHACYAFTRDAYKFKYLPQSASPDVYLEQGRYIAHLSTWLAQFNSQILSRFLSLCKMDDDNNFASTTSRDYVHALTLRMTALSILIHLSCILNPYENAFTAHALRLQQIVEDGELVLLLRNRQQQHDSKMGKTTTYEALRPGPGIIQPLFLTAFKYRHPLWRRRAIACLAIAGREGPWRGRREACITRTLLILEEEMWLSSLTSEKEYNNTPTLAPLSRREEGAGHFIPESGVGQATSQRKCKIPSIFPPDKGIIPPPSPLLLNPSQQYPPEHTPINNMGMDSLSPLTTWSSISTPMSSFVPTTIFTSPHSLFQSSPMPTSTHYPSPLQIVVRFSKCTNMDALLAYPCGHGRLGLRRAGLELRLEEVCGEEERVDLRESGEDRIEREDKEGLEVHLFGLCKRNPFWRGWEEGLEVL